MNGQYEVLTPWAEVDPIPLRGISPRLTDLADKTMGLFINNAKISSLPMINVVEQKLKERFPTLKFSRFQVESSHAIEMHADLRARFNDWVKSVDAVILAVGD